MGYDLHITRKEFWIDDDDEGAISREEWLSYVARDPELTLSGSADDEATWLNHTYDGYPIWFAFDDYAGTIYTKNPTPEIVGKLWRIAQALGASVQGEDGEHYDENSDVIAR